MLDNVLHADFARPPEETQDLESQGMRHGLERSRGDENIFLARNQKIFYVLCRHAHVTRPLSC